MSKKKQGTSVEKRRRERERERKRRDKAERRRLRKEGVDDGEAKSEEPVLEVDPETGLLREVVKESTEEPPPEEPARD